jgi:serine/threonine protein kinase
LLSTDQLATRSASPAVGHAPRYRLVSRIATGGMAEVFLALMSSAVGAAKPVVIKRLWPELARDPDQVALFLDEARISLLMSHPNVVHAYESGADGERQYLTLEYLDGQPLKHLFDRVAVEGGLSLPLALKIVCDVLAGLDYIHNLQDLSGRSLGIVHRDVSPQNVFITYEGAVKVVDFGIAQSVDNQVCRTAREMKGRIAYMAPEQVAGLSVDRRADLFSVGVVLWELAVGRRLWQGMSEADITRHLLECKPMPTLPRNRGFPPGLAGICARALASDPADRYDNAGCFLADLGELMTGSAPMHARLLGDLLESLFSSSRTLTRTMIQQGLCDESASSADDAARVVAQEAGARHATAEYPTSAQPSGTVVAGFARSAITTSGKEITGVNPAVRSVTRWRIPRLWAVVGLAVVLALTSFAVGGKLILFSKYGRRPRSSQPPSTSVVTTSTVSPVPTTGLAMPVLVPLPEQSPTMTDESWQSSDRAPVSVHARLGKRAKAPRKDGGIGLSAPRARSSEQDVFDTDVKTSPHRALRTLDREDPYLR